METKYYAPQQGLHCLTMATHPGTLTEADVTDNLVRMILMNDGLSAKEAMEEARQLPVKELRKIIDAEQWDYNSPEFQDYLTQKKIHPSLNLKLEPVKDEQEMWQTLDEFNLSDFQEWELPTVEWD